MFTPVHTCFKSTEDVNTSMFAFLCPTSVTGRNNWLLSDYTVRSFRRTLTEAPSFALCVYSAVYSAPGFALFAYSAVLWYVTHQLLKVVPQTQSFNHQNSYYNSDYYYLYIRLASVYIRIYTYTYIYVYIRRICENGVYRRIWQLEKAYTIRLYDIRLPMIYRSQTQSTRSSHALLYITRNIILSII